MRKIIISTLITGIALLALSILGLYATIWLFPNLAMQYFNPEFGEQAKRFLLYFIHPFIVAAALSWFWHHFKFKFGRSELKKGLQVGGVYTLIAVLPNMWLIYSAMNVSLAMVATWFVFGMSQGILAGMILQRTDP